MRRMLSTLGAAWRNVAKRLTVDWLILSAGAVTILLAMVLLAAGPIYADAVTQSALSRSLSSADPADATVEVEVRTPPAEYDVVDGIATSHLEAAFSGVDITIHRAIESETIGLGTDTGDGPVELAQFRHMEGVEDHAALVAGAWPEDTGTQTAISEATADLIGAEIGDRLVMQDGREPDRRIETEVVAIFVPDPADPYWAGDALPLEGALETGGFRTYGPFLLAAEPLLGTTSRATATWRAVPDYSTLTATNAPGVRGRVAGLQRGLDEALAAVDDDIRRFSEFSVTTGVDRLLSGAGRSLTVTRSAVLALLIQLAILAGYALALSAGLLVESRRSETFLIHTRGASPRQLVTMSALEALLLVVPAALVAPTLAAWSLEALASAGPLEPIGLAVTPTVTGESRLLAAMAALAAIVALAWPVWRGARRLGGNNRGGRQRTRSASQRTGVDVALLGLAVIAFWQLQSLGPEISSTIRGRFGVDPILIAAPTLGLLAGSVLALRIVPLLARLAEGVASGGRGVVTALASWQMARRPVRYARSALLLIMAVAIGFFSAAYTATWLGSQRDQADFQVGADIRAQPNRSTSNSVPDLHLIAAHEGIPGVVRSLPLLRMVGPLTGSASPATHLLLDTAAASEVVGLRADLAPGFSNLMGELAAARPETGGIPLPGDPSTVGVVVETHEVSVETGDGPLPPGFAGHLSMVIADAGGLFHRIALGPIAVGEGPQTLTAELTGEEGTYPSYPLEVVALEIESQYPGEPGREVILDLIDLVAGDDAGTAEPVLWDRGPDAWNQELVALGQVLAQPSITEPDTQPDHALRLEIETGLGFGGDVTYALRPVSTAPSTYPVVVTSAWLEETGRRIGDVITLDTLGTGASQAAIAGAIEAFPGPQAVSGGPLIIADLATVQTLRYTPGGAIALLDETWLEVAGDQETVAGALHAAPFRSASVLTRDDRFGDLSTDPVALGTIGALTIGFIAAAIFAAVGFAVSATVSARERVTEFGLLRALGLSPRQLGLWMTVEQGLLVLSSLALGTLVGWALTTVILPLISVTQQGARAMPDVEIVYPWSAVLAIQAGLLVVLAVIVAVMTVVLRRRGLGSLLRMGED
jgi:hypothetical protein